jgi:hypothetical protein
VLTPYTYIDHRLAQSLLRPHVLSFLDLAPAFGKTDLDLAMEQLLVPSRSFLATKTLDEVHLARTYGVIVQFSIDDYALGIDVLRYAMTH